MRAIITQLLAAGMCFGLFIVTCPLAAQAAAPAPQPATCCSLSAELEHCDFGSENSAEEPEGCCVTHNCGGVIAATPAAVSSSRCDAPQLLMSFSQAIAYRADRPPVPPPRPALI